MPIFGRNKDKENKKPSEGEAENNTEKSASEIGQAMEDTDTVKESSAAVPKEEEAESAEKNTDEVPQRKYETPEGFDFNRYFLAERRMILENVSYETQSVQPNSKYELTARDTIVAQVLGQVGVKVTYNRALRFEPDGPFTLSVSFAVMLVFNPGTRDEIDWKQIDMAGEFRKNCPSIVSAMMNRASLLVAEITSASGGVPIIPGR